jgi:hypothetical protein
VGHQIEGAVTARTGEAVQRLAASAERLDAAADHMTAIDERVEAGLARARNAAREAAVEHAGAVRGELDAVVAEIRATAGRFDAAVSEMDGLRRTVLGYLADRDRIVERDRDELLVELLDEFVEGMSRREARRAAGRMAEARDRARDKRDADRFRQLEQQGGPRTSPSRTISPADIIVPAAPREDGAPVADEPSAAGDPAEQEPGTMPPGEAEAASGRRTCEVCGFVAKTPGGLSAHKRKHA